MKVPQSYPTLCKPMFYTVHGILQARELEWVAIPFSRGSSQTKDRTQVSHIAGKFSTSEPPGKPKKTGVGSLSLLQWIVPTQESNRGLLHSGRFFTSWTTKRSLEYSVQFSRSVVSYSLWPPWIAAHQASLSTTHSREFTQIHVHSVSDTIQPSHPLSSPSPPAFNLSQHQGLLQWVSSSYQVAKALEF